MGLAMGLSSAGEVGLDAAESFECCDADRTWQHHAIDGRLFKFGFMMSDAIKWVARVEGCHQRGASDRTIGEASFEPNGLAILVALLAG